MKEEIKKAGYKSQKDIAFKLEKNHATIRRWERIKDPIFVEFLRMSRICEALRKSEIKVEEKESYIRFTIRKQEITVFDNG